MATQESSYHAAGMVGRFMVGLAAFVVLLGIGYYSVWPKIQATYQSGVQRPVPTTAAVETSEIDRLKAQNAAIQAQLNAARAAQQSTIVQQVPAGEAPQPIHVQSAPQVPVENGSAPAEAAPHARPIVIIHQTSADGTRQTITGSGACAVAAKGARRCGDK